MCDPKPNLTETLAYLRNERPAVVQAFLNGDFSLWIGSGASREKVPGVPGIIESAVKALFAGQASEEGEAYSAALRRILGFVQREDLLESGAPIEDWPFEELVPLLSNHYSLILGTKVDTAEGGLCIVWDILDLPGQYRVDGEDPDAEHRFTALLVEEGVVAHLVTTNWDPLIERACNQIGGSVASSLHVISCPDDLHGANPPTLLKAHGCAVRATDDQARHRKFFAASKESIDGWPENQDTVPLRDFAANLLREKHAAFVGLSGQDSDLQALARACRLGREETYPLDPPKVVFSGKDIGLIQDRILRDLYPDEVIRTVLSNAALEPCAKPLLGGLFVLSLLQKAVSLSDTGGNDPNIPQWLLGCLLGLPDAYEALLCRRYDEMEDCNERWRLLSQEVPFEVHRALRLYKKVEAPDSAYHYSAGLPGSLSALRQQGIDRPDLLWFLLVWGTLRRGPENGRWDLMGPNGTDVSEGHCQVQIGDSSVRVFLLEDSDGGRARLEMNESMDVEGYDDVVLVYPRGGEPKKEATSPRRRLPGGGNGPGVRQVWFRDLVMTVDDEDLSSLEEEMVHALVGGHR